MDAVRHPKADFKNNKIPFDRREDPKVTLNLAAGGGNRICPNLNFAA
jgi:hypothetical protein